MKKKWYDDIDFYKVSGMTLIWVASWIFMLPVKTNINSPLFDNIWGEILTVAGISREITIEAQQTPDLISGIIALITVSILHLRGILSVSSATKKNIKFHSDNSVVTVLSVMSLITHTLFFTMLAKIFLFPDNGDSTILQNLKENIYITVFAAFCLGGMIFGLESVAKILVILFSMAALLKNVSFVSRYMGISGFSAIILAASGFYLEIIKDGFSRPMLLADMNLLLGNYRNAIIIPEKFLSTKTKETADE